MKVDEFWSASESVISRVYDTLKPGGYAVWVCGDFVRDGKRVRFSRQWLNLCMRFGFTPVEWIRAWKVDRKGVQLDLWGNGHEQTKE